MPLRPPRPVGAPGLRELLVEDWKRHDRLLSHPGFHALAVYRFGQWRKTQRQLVRKPVGAAYILLNMIIRNVYGIEIYDSTVVGRRVRIGHHVGVILGAGAVIGDDCLVRQNVTVGQALDRHTREEQPVLGQGVQLGAGATVLGKVRVGDGAIIGPHALVMTDVPAGATVWVSPTRVMRRADGASAPASKPAG